MALPAQVPNLLALLSPEFNVCTWNIQGGINDDPAKADLLMQDLESRKVHVACLQETHTKTNTFINEKGILHCFGENRYGQGFYISQALIGNIYGFEVISERISILHITLAKTEQATRISIINAYGPTSMLTKENPDIATIYYTDLRNALTKCRRMSAIVIIGGDMNAKLGKKAEQELFLGSYGNGIRNENGRQLATFMSENYLFASNTAFQHKANHIITWRGQIHGRRLTNQIDYILLLKTQTRLLKQSRVYRGHKFPSDHDMVITTLNLRRLYQQTRRPSTSELWRPDLTLLATDVTLQARFRSEIENTPLDTEDPTSIEENYANMVNIINNAAKRSIPPRQRYSDGIRHLRHDSTLQTLYFRRRNLILKLKRHRTRPQELQKRKRAIDKAIKKRIRVYWKRRYATLVSQLDNIPLSNGHKLFEITRLLKVTKPHPLTLIDSDGITCVQPRSILRMVTDHYKNFYNQPGRSAPSPWIGDPRPLSNPITTEEVRDAIKLLNNGRASGPDGIYAEYLKYGGPSIAPHLSALYNKIFEKHESLPALLNGTLVALNKPGKAKTVQNTRPITLLNISRKLLSLIVLKSARPALESFISLSQSGFRRNRSTTDVVWSYRWLIAYVQKYQTSFHLMGIDLSKAFDCIDRTKLMNVVSSIVSEDNYRIIKYLMSETTLQARIRNKSGNSFSTSIGTPQGDGLSPLLFVVYLEAALRSFRLAPNLNFRFDETAYADDQDFICANQESNEIIINTLPAYLQDWNLQVNKDKTERHRIHRESIKQLSAKKLGSRLTDTEDLKFRSIQAQAAMAQLYKVWNSVKHISIDTKLRVYQAFIIPVLTYNLAASGASDTKLEQLESLQRRFLRRMLNIYYPVRISNQALYSRCNVKRISTIVTTARWKLFGHLLRQPSQTPANKIMEAYFSSQEIKYRGRRNISLPILLHRDLQHIHRALKTTKDLQDLRNIARNRRAWKRISGKILTATITTNKRKEEANTLARARKRARERTRIIIPRQLWLEVAQRRQDDPAAAPRRKRIRLTLSPATSVGDAVPLTSSDMDTTE
jgi:exonuclease III